MHSVGKSQNVLSTIFMSAVSSGGTATDVIQKSGIKIEILKLSYIYLPLKQFNICCKHMSIQSAALASNLAENADLRSICKAAAQDPSIAWMHAGTSFF